MELVGRQVVNLRYYHEFNHPIHLSICAGRGYLGRYCLLLHFFSDGMAAVFENDYLPLLSIYHNQLFTQHRFYDPPLLEHPFRRLLVQLPSLHFIHQILLTMKRFRSVPADRNPSISTVELQEEGAPLVRCKNVEPDKGIRTPPISPESPGDLRPSKLRRHGSKLVSALRSMTNSSKSFS